MVNVINRTYLKSCYLSEHWINSGQYWGRCDKWTWKCWRDRTSQCPRCSCCPQWSQCFHRRKCWYSRWQSHRRIQGFAATWEAPAESMLWHLWLDCELPPGSVSFAINQLWTCVIWQVFFYLFYFFFLTVIKNKKS